MSDLATLERDVIQLREKVVFLDGWREGESNRYDRLEKSVERIDTELVGIHGELRHIHSRIDALADSLNGRIDALASSMDGRFKDINARIDALASSMDGRFKDVNARIDALSASVNSRFDRFTFLLIGTLLTVIAQLVFTVVKAS